MKENVAYLPYIPLQYSWSLGTSDGVSEKVRGSNYSCYDVVIQVFYSALHGYTEFIDPCKTTVTHATSANHYYSRTFHLYKRSALTKTKDSPQTWQTGHGVIINRLLRQMSRPESALQLNNTVVFLKQTHNGLILYFSYGTHTHTHATCLHKWAKNTLLKHFHMFQWPLKQIC